MPVSIDGLDLVGAAESDVGAAVDPTISTPPTGDTGDTIIVALAQQDEPALSGRATGIRLASRAGYSSDPETALAEWVQDFVTLPAPTQGGGYTLSDDERNDSIDVVVDTVEWTVNEGAPLEVQWELEGIRGEGVFEQQTRVPTTASPRSSATLGGYDLGSIMEKRTQVAVDVDATALAYSGAGSTIVAPASGSIREVTISGRKGGTASELRTFRDNMRSLLGGNTSATLKTGFPGTDHEVVLTEFEDSFTAGQPATMQYIATVIEGTTL